MLLVLVLALPGPPVPAAPAVNVRKIARVEAIHLGVSHNFELISKRLEQQRFEVLGRSAWRPYSPSVFLDASYRQSPLLVTGGRTDDRFVDYTVGAGWRSIIGTTVGASATLSQGLPGSSVPYGNQVSLTLTQPLLKDAWLTGASLPLREADLQSMIQKEIFRGEINTLISSIETAYWDLALAEADLQIKTRSRDRAKQQFDDTAENIRRGIIADVEIYIVEENVVFFEQELLRADQGLRLTRRRLAELLALDPEVPLDADDDLLKPNVTLPVRAEFVARGLDQSPTVLAQRRRTELSSARLSYASNQALPEVNLNAAVTVSSIAVLRDPLPETRAGVSFAIPLDRGAINASVENARIDNERQEVELRNVQQKVQFELENAMTELETNLRLLSLATKRVELAGLKLEAQNDKYKNGISTLADVVRFQRDLDDALIASQRSIRAVHVGQLRLLTGQGTLADSVGVGLK